jgi:hypothetical protein
VIASCIYWSLGRIADWDVLDECLKTCSFVTGIVNHSLLATSYSVGASRNLKKPESVTWMRVRHELMSHNGNKPDNVPRDQLEPRQVGPAKHTPYLL